MCYSSIARPVLHGGYMDYRDWVERHKDDLPIELFQREDETDDAYFGFTCYLYLGRARSTRRAWHQYQIEKKLLPEGTPYDRNARMSRNFAGWSSEHDWVNRAKALDDYIDSMKMVETIQRQSRILDNSWNDYELLRTEILEAIGEANGGLSPRELKELALALKYADDVGRRTAGLPSTISSAKSNKNDEDDKRSSDISSDELHNTRAKADRELDEWQSSRSNSRTVK